MSQSGVLIVMVATSLATWWSWWRRWRKMGFLWPRETPKDSTWSPVLLVPVVSYVTLCVVTVFLPRKAISIAQDAEPIMLTTITINCFISFFLLIGLRATSPRRVAENDFNLADWKTQLSDGLETALAGFVPVLAVLLATQVWRTPQDQHVILQTLMQDASFRTLALVVVSAVLIVPLAEELLFRVVLLGWLKTCLSRGAALTISSLAFAAMHGWPDGIALVPLAFLLGSLYDHQHRLLPIYTAHAFFNLTNILLTLAAR